MKQKGYSDVKGSLWNHLDKKVLLRHREAPLLLRVYASINVLNLMRAATGSQCKETKRGVTWAILGSLKISRAAAFWIICRGLIVFDGSPARRALQQSSLEMTRSWTRSCAACSVRKGLVFLMLCSANLQDRAVFAMCSLKGSWSSKITPRFLTEADGVIVEEPSWMMNHSVELKWQGRQEAQSLPGWAVGDVLSSMPRCPPGSLRSVSYRWIIWLKR